MYKFLLSLSALFISAVYADLISNLTNQSFTILTPSDSGYSDASTAFNLRYTFQPAAIAFPKSAEDVSTILSLTTSFNFQAVARSGGHSYIANGVGGKDGVVVVDMSDFNTVTFDPSTNIATIGAGNRLGDVALALNNSGRALPHGTCPYVGIGGHSGHGGYGFSSRKWGLTLDTITSLEVVLANGTIVTTSTSQYPDLFWALRGSSSSFGIVTSIQANTFPAPSSTTVFQYTWDLSASSAASALAAFQSFALSPALPEDFGGAVVFRQGSAPGRVFFGLTGGWYAPDDQFDAVIQPLLETLPTPATTKLTVGSYINSVQFLGGLSGRLNTTGIPDGSDTFYAKSLMTPEASPLSNISITALTNYLANQAFAANTKWFVEFELYGGTNSAINNVALDATAFAHRSSIFTIQLYTSAPNKVPPFPTEGFSLLDDIVNIIVNNNPVGWDYGAYTNYIDDRLSNWQNLYYGTHYPKLRSLKDLYDPADTFKFPLSIEE